MAEEQEGRKPRGPTRTAIDESRSLVHVSHEHEARSRTRLARSLAALDRTRNQLQAFVLRRAMRRPGDAPEGPPPRPREGQR